MAEKAKNWTAWVLGTVLLLGQVVQIWMGIAHHAAQMQAHKDTLKAIAAPSKRGLAWSGDAPDNPKGTDINLSK